ncbi:single-stranded DNA-binding protein [Actinomadura craniellae]|uniref:Single-stranded DNA-binding protein n=1 Tax=Actinomadura craniellae TaxID=2231787 RepID=A0A365H0V2_9ACTN|nr:single-stranded DNA-binding protein [Actinomadura craniellae]RAY11823.1 single-stranded DNA-binding protein [Actinomadura craniellae]
MNDAHITVIGWLAEDPHYTMTTNGTPFLSLRVGCTPRRFDRQTGRWQDQTPMFLTVNCWRNLADNVNASELRRGQPVVVTGRLRIREYVKDGQFRFSPEVEATTLGHDMTRGSAHFRPVQRGGAMTDDDRLEAQQANDRWALGGPRTESGPDASQDEGSTGDPWADGSQADRGDGTPGGADQEDGGDQGDPVDLRATAA